MKQVTVNVPDKKLSFFLQLIESLGLSSTTGETLVSEDQKKIVRHRIKTAKPGDYIEWERAKKKIKLG